MHMHTPHEHLEDDDHDDDSGISKEERYAAAKRATLLSVMVNVLLSVAKILAGIVGHSAAMMADGIHSLSDLISDGVVLLTMRIASKEADEDHPYGHGKFETIASLFIAAMLLAVAIGISLDAIQRINNLEALEIPTQVALYAALLSLVAKELLFQYTIRVGRRLNAKALSANARHQPS